MSGFLIPQAVISVRGLVISYGPRQVVNGISFDVHEGEIFALLGSNGAGKTTTVEVLEGLRPRAGGTVSVLGHDRTTSGKEAS
ncbi:MAG: ATP-binding cassette domain-containing protein [Actinomycetota bacterium]